MPESFGPSELFVNYLKGVKTKLKITSDRQLAVKLGVTQSYVSQIMSGGQIPNDDICVRIAELAGDDPIHVLLIAHIDRSSIVSRLYWEHLFKLYGLLPEEDKKFEELAKRKKSLRLYQYAPHPHSR